MNEVSRLEKITTSIIKIIFLIIVAFLFICSIFGSATVNAKEHTDYINDNLLMHIAVITGVSAITAFMKYKKIKINKKVLIVAILLWIVACVSWILMTKFQPKADQKYVLNSAMQFRENKFSSVQEKGYLYMFPHQCGLTLYFYLMSFIFNFDTYLGLQFLNVCALLVAFFAIYKTMKQLNKNSGIQRATFLGLLLFIPIALYITFIYGNIVGLACSSLAVMFEMCYLKSEKKRYIIGMALFESLAVALKSNYLIVLVAMVILLIVEAIFRKKIKYITPIIAILVFYICGNYSVKLAIKSITNTEVNDGVPSITYIAMGMQEGKMAQGWYNGYNKKIYKKNGYNSQVASDKAKESIRERIEKFKNDPKYAVDFYYKKTVSQWNNPTFQSIWVNLNRKGRCRAE
ncbi:MAG: hypothetical protein IKD76_05710 [Clostridia bacterium]|nr:hypothetical protein [Clostridia bacterium]